MNDIFLMQFLINATHDIRSPLTLIMGPLNKLKNRLGDADRTDLWSWRSS